MDLKSGQNAPVGTGAMRVVLSATPANQVPSLDLSAFLLSADGRVKGDGGFVFYGQPRDPTGAVALDAATATFQVDPSRLPPGIERIVLALTIDTEVAGLRSFSQFRSVLLTLECGATSLRFPLDTTSMGETALIVAELYMRNAAWKMRAVGQGYVGGLAPLARNYGVDISEKAVPPAAPPHPAPTPEPPASRKRIDLSKRQPVSLTKPIQGYGKITINLNWSRGEKKGWLGTKSSGIDLDLGCMVELADGGKSVVQALGNSFGDYERPPYAKLLGDDRTGESTAGETLLINGGHWAAYRRVLVYAFIYEGVPNWATANAIVTVSAPGTPELVVRLDEHATGKGMCAIALLENEGGHIRVTKLIEYFAGHEPMDRAFGFGFRWQAGRK